MIRWDGAQIIFCPTLGTQLANAAEKVSRTIVKAVTAADAAGESTVV